jgi:hypothetical protein
MNEDEFGCDYFVYDPNTAQTTTVTIAQAEPVIDPEVEKERLWQLVVQVSR